MYVTRLFHIRLRAQPIFDGAMMEMTVCNTLSNPLSLSRLLILLRCNTRQHTAPHYDTLQQTATHCSILQYAATHCNTMLNPLYLSHLLILLRCNTLQHATTHCNILQHTATHCNTLQQTAIHWSILQHTATLCQIFSPCRVCWYCSGATRCNTLQHSATHWNTLQHTATHCNKLQHTAPHCTTLSNLLSLSPLLILLRLSICVTWPIYMCDPFICVPWLFITCNVTHHEVQLDSSTCVIWRIYIKIYINVVTHSYAQDDCDWKNPPPPGGVSFTIFPHQEPWVRGPPSNHLVRILRGGSSYARFLMREHSKLETPPGGGGGFFRSTHQRE